MKKILLVLILSGTFILLLALSSGNYNAAHDSFHTASELTYFSAQRVSSPLVPGQWFLPSSSCRGCHGYDSLQLANVDENGSDVNLVSHWESSMMALATKDPFWRAKVSQEILINPGHSGALQDKCTSCHAPAGRYNHFYQGLGDYLLSDVMTDSLGMDGVNCVSCHAIDIRAGETFSGNIPYDTTRLIYGPFPAPFQGPMQLYEGYTPTYSLHTDKSSFCSSCHTLITQTIDLNGNLTGGEFVEQATYQEYLNSNFPANDIKCQTCHMPQLADPVVIANGFINLQSRFPFNQHTFAGANHFMLSLMKSNKTSLGIDVPDIHFDSTISATLRNLQSNSVDLQLLFDSAANDTGYFRVHILNKVGHKFPSGYPSRRAVLQFFVSDASGDTLFRSGSFTPDFRVVGEDPSYEPHHDIINQDDIPQSYELVMGDVNSNFTSLLARASVLLKDNRLPPTGFTTLHSSYDTVRISADAIADADFNKLNGNEGTGADYIHFHVPMSSVNGTVHVQTNFYYQTLPPKWLDEMFQLSSIEIDTFRTMYTNADRTPVLIAAESTDVVINSTGQQSSDQFLSVGPTASSTGTYTIIVSRYNKIKSIDVFDQSGKLVKHIDQPDQPAVSTIEIEGNQGIYFIRINTLKGVTTKKVLKF